MRKCRTKRKSCFKIITDAGNGKVLHAYSSGLFCHVLKFSPKERITFEYMDLPFHSVAWIQLVLEGIQGFRQRKIGANSEEGRGIDINGKIL